MVPDRGHDDELHRELGITVRSETMDFNGYFDRRYIMEVCDGLVPELQRRGLTRKGYPHKNFRDNLLEF